MQGKYVIISTKKFGDIPFIFPKVIGHDEFFGMINIEDKKVIGAGFYHVDKNGSFVATGESVSLNIKSRKEDSFMLTKDLQDKLDYDLI